MESEKKDRRDEGNRMTEDQFRQFTINSLNAGTERFKELHRTISEHFAILSRDMEENTIVTKNNSILATRAVGLAEEAVLLSGKSLTASNANTLLAQKALDMANKTHKDTSGWVKISKLPAKISGDVASGTEKISRLSKILGPIIGVGIILSMLFHGHFPTWKEVIEILFK